LSDSGSLLDFFSTGWEEVGTGWDEVGTGWDEVGTGSDEVAEDDGVVEVDEEVDEEVDDGVEGVEELTEEEDDDNNASGSTKHPLIKSMALLSLHFVHISGEHWLQPSNSSEHAVHCLCSLKAYPSSQPMHWSMVHLLHFSP
jgi:hypothetical protein